MAITGAIYTSNFDGTDINENLYDAKSDVYLTGGPCQGGSHLDPGDYYFQVSIPNTATKLSTDAIGNRKFSVGANGFISGTSGTHVTHPVGCAGVTGVTIQLLPYDDTTNPGGEYKLTVATAATVEACPGFAADSTSFLICGAADQKSDNFKVGDNGDLKITKTIEGGPAGVTGSFPVSVDCGTDGTFTGTIVFPTPGFITITDIPAGASCTVTEGNLPAPPAGYTYGAPTYTGNPATILKDGTANVGVVNHLNLIPVPGFDVVKTVSTSAAGPWPGVHNLTVQVGTTVFFRITITNTGNVPLSSVVLSDNTYDLVAKGCVIPTTLAVGAKFDCDYSVVAGLGSVTNVATGDTGQTPPDSDTATITGTPLPPAPTLTIVKTNNAPLDELQLPTADEGDTVTFTLAYTHTGDDVTLGVITDVLPVGLTYKDGSATGNAEFTFDGYNALTRTLTWTAASVTASGSVGYQATVDEDAAELAQPLKNVATIASEETDPDSDDSDVFVAAPPQAETSVPTPPQTDIGSTESSASSASLLLALLALAGIALAVVFVAPTPASVRKRIDR